MNEKQVTVFLPVVVNADDLVTSEDGKIHQKVEVNCPRCGGTGHWGRGRGPSSRCFRCKGSGSLSNLRAVYSASQVASKKW